MATHLPELQHTHSSRGRGAAAAVAPPSADSHVTIFSYGSLLDPQSAASTMPSMRNHRPGTLSGWRRVFSLVGVNDIQRGRTAPDALDCAVMAIRPDAGAPSLIGCLFDIPRAELDVYLRREARYKALQVSCDNPLDDVNEGGSRRPVEALTVVEQTDDEFRASLTARGGDYEAEVGRHYLWGSLGALWGRRNIVPRGPYLAQCLNAAKAMDEAAAATWHLPGLRCHHNVLHDALLADGVTSVAKHLHGTDGDSIAVFGYGSNGIAQLRERCQNPQLEAIAATLPGHVLCFAGRSARRAGAVASVIEAADQTVYGSVVHMSESELQLLDGFEGTKPDNPYSKAGVYRRQRVTCVRRDGTREEGIMYVKNKVAWITDPSEAYLEACLAHIHGEWPERARTIDVRDGDGVFKFTYPPHPNAQAAASPAASGAAGKGATAGRGGAGGRGGQGGMGHGPQQELHLEVGNHYRQINVEEAKMSRTVADDGNHQPLVHNWQMFVRVVGGDQSAISQVVFVLHPSFSKTEIKKCDNGADGRTRRCAARRRPPPPLPPPQMGRPPLSLSRPYLFGLLFAASDATAPPCLLLTPWHCCLF